MGKVLKVNWRRIAKYNSTKFKFVGVFFQAISFLYSILLKMTNRGSIIPPPCGKQYTYVLCKKAFLQPCILLGITLNCMTIFLVEWCRWRTTIHLTWPYFSSNAFEKQTRGALNTLSTSILLESVQVKLFWNMRIL